MKFLHYIAISFLAGALMVSCKEPLPVVPLEPSTGQDNKSSDGTFEVVLDITEGRIVDDEMTVIPTVSLTILEEEASTSSFSIRYTIDEGQQHIQTGLYSSKTYRLVEGIETLSYGSHDLNVSVVRDDNNSSHAIAQGKIIVRDDAGTNATAKLVLTRNTYSPMDPDEPSFDVYVGEKGKLVITFELDNTVVTDVRADEAIGLGQWSKTGNKLTVPVVVNQVGKFAVNIILDDCGEEFTLTYMFDAEKALDPDLGINYDMGADSDELMVNGFELSPGKYNVRVRAYQYLPFWNKVELLSSDESVVSVSRREGYKFGSNGPNTPCDDFDFVLECKKRGDVTLTPRVTLDVPYFEELSGVVVNSLSVEYLVGRTADGKRTIFTAKVSSDDDSVWEMLSEEPLYFNCDYTHHGTRTYYVATTTAMPPNNKKVVEDSDPVNVKERFGVDNVAPNEDFTWLNLTPLYDEYMADVVTYDSWETRGAHAYYHEGLTKGYTLVIDDFNVNVSFRDDIERPDLIRWDLLYKNVGAGSPLSQPTWFHFK